MTRSTALTFSLALALAGIATAPALAQTPPASADGLEGRPVKGADGVVLGSVERVVRHADGRPAQVLVRPKGLRPAGPKSLSFAAVRVAGDGISVPLTKAEFDAMPSVEPAVQ